MATIRPRKNKDGKIIGHQAIVRKKAGPNQSKVFTRRADAVVWASIVESEIERGEFIDRSEADRKTLHDALADYRDEVSIRKRGKKQELVRIAAWQKHKLAKIPLGKLKAKDFAKWRDEQVEAGRSPSTINIGFSLISHLYKHARKEWGIPVQNPITDLWRPKKRKHRERRYREGEEVTLLRAAATVDALLPAAIIVLTETAMRREELAGMQKANLYLSLRVLHVPEAKNDNPRDIPLSMRAIESLSSLPSRIDGRVWPWSAEQLSRLFKKARKLAGMDDFQLRDLRHEATSRLAIIYSAHELARIRGDKTLNMLMTYYHPTVAELAAKLDRA